MKPNIQTKIGHMQLAKVTSGTTSSCALGWMFQVLEGHRVVQAVRSAAEITKP